MHLGPSVDVYLSSTCSLLSDQSAILRQLYSIYAGFRLQANAFAESIGRNERMSEFDGILELLPSAQVNVQLSADFFRYWTGRQEHLLRMLKEAASKADELEDMTFRQFKPFHFEFHNELVEAKLLTPSISIDQTKSIGRGGS